MAWKEYRAEYRLKEAQESMDRCTGHHDIIEILLKKVLNAIQSILTTEPPCQGKIDFYESIIM